MQWHVASSGYGEKIPDVNPVSEAFEKYPPQCSTNTQLLLRDAYETTYNIFNHDVLSKGRPLALVAKQWAEEVTSGSLMFERMDQYHECGILKYFGISWERWIEQPKYINDQQLIKAKAWGEKDNALTEGMQAQLAAMQHAAKLAAAGKGKMS